jgi:hypothetical protein
VLLISGLSSEARARGGRSLVARPAARFAA